MSARGIAVNYGTDPFSYLEYSTAGLSMASNNIAICGWMKIMGTNAGNRGQSPFAIKCNNTISGEVTFRDNTFSNTSPWTVAGYSQDTVPTSNDTGTFSPATSESWFWAILWDRTTSKATYFAAKDGAGSLTQATDATAIGLTTFDQLRIGAQFNGDYGNNTEHTCVKVWVGNTGPSTAANFLAEMKSATVVNSNSLYAFYPLLNSSDLSDASGLGHGPLVANGTVTSGSMDPLDIQGSSGGATFPGGLVFGRLQVRH